MPETSGRSSMSVHEVKARTAKAKAELEIADENFALHRIGLTQYKKEIERVLTDLNEIILAPTVLDIN